VANAIKALQGRMLDGLLKIMKFARRPADMYLAVISDHSDAGGVISSIFKTPEAVKNEWHDLFRPDVTNNSAHGILRILELGA
jgi:hypothetical protein